MRVALCWICYCLGDLCSKLLVDSEIMCHLFYRPYQTFMRWSWTIQGDRNGKWWPWGTNAVLADAAEKSNDSTGQS